MHWASLTVKYSKVLVSIVHYYEHVSKALRYGWLMLARVSHSFTCHPHTNHTCRKCRKKSGVIGSNDWPFDELSNELT